MGDGRLALRTVDAAFVRETQASGFRQRREGLAYRLTWRRSGVRSRKRVEPGGAGLRLRRRMIDGLRHAISRGCDPVIRLAQALRQPGLFLFWARFMLKPIMASLIRGAGWERD